jgi:glycosyltransferase involved in cell wall biosynthesis
VKTALLLAYYFPPAGGAGVQRTVKFVRYLPDFGYRSVVVTAALAGGDEWSPDDSSLGDEVAGSVEVLKIGGSPPPLPGRWRGRSERWFRLEPARQRWWRTGAVETSLAGAGEADVVYATMSPWASGYAALETARRLNLPWVADLRDPWALDEMMFYPTGVHRRLETRAMGKLLSQADGVVMNTEEARWRLLQRFPQMQGRVVEVIPNGYDEADFAGPPPPSEPDIFKIVHAGHLHTQLGSADTFEARMRCLIGARVKGVDFLTRSHVHRMAAIDRAVAERPQLAQRLQLHLVGGLTDADRATIGSKAVHTHGYVSHAQSVAALRTADLLFLPMHNLPVGTRATIVPGKTYEYLASGRPILAAVPDGDARDLLERMPRAIVVRPDDVDAMAKAILDRVDAPRAADADHADMAAYERRAQTERLAEIFDRVTR